MAGVGSRLLRALLLALLLVSVPTQGLALGGPGGDLASSGTLNPGSSPQAGTAASSTSAGSREELETQLRVLEQVDPARAAELRKALGQKDVQSAQESGSRESKGEAEAVRQKGAQKPGEEPESKGEKRKDSKGKARAQKEGKAQELGEVQEGKGQTEGQALALSKPEKVQSAIESLFSKIVSADKSFAVEQFGYDLFQGGPAAFTQGAGALVGPDYVLGPGDEFTVTIWGLVDAVHKVRVSQEGTVVFPKVGEVPVAGVSYGNLKEHIERAYSKQFKNFHLSVSIGEIRAIQVFIVGEVQKPGSYALSSLSTVFNALFACGGPKKSGTLRDIRLLRNGKVVRHLDLYDFLLKGDKSQDVRLQDQDTIFVPLVGPVVAVAGQVYRPAIYEIKESASLGDVLDLAGGVRPTGYLARVQIERVRAHDKKSVLDVDLARLKGGGGSRIVEGEIARIPVQNMDFVKVFPINPLPQEVVTLSGHVVRPGLYQLKPGMRIKDVVKSYEDLLPDAALEYAKIVRRAPHDIAQAMLPFHVGRMLEGDPGDNLPLQNHDEIVIFSQADFKDLPQVTVEGEVRRPGTFPLLKETRIRDVLYQAGSLTDDAYLSKAELVRMKPNRELERVYIDLRKALDGDPDHNLVLRDEDRLVVHSLWEPQFRKTVSISGAVKKPGTYPLVAGMRVADLIFTAGGLQKTAYLKEAEVMRYEIVDTAKVQTHTMKIDLEKALAGNSSDDLELKDYDHVIVKVLNFDLERAVTVRGEVRFPGTYRIVKGERLSSVLRRAGGFTSRAYPKGAIFIRESVKKAEQEQMQKLSALHAQRVSSESSALAMGELDKPQADAQKEFLAAQRDFPQRLASQVTLGRMIIHLDEPEKLEGTADDLVLEDGDRLEVPAVPHTVNVLGSVRNPTAVLYQDELQASDYIRLAGGLTPDADWEGAYLVKADGSAVMLFDSVGFSNHGPGANRNGGGSDEHRERIERGDTIVVPLKLEVKTRPVPIWQAVPDPYEATAGKK